MTINSRTRRGRKQFFLIVTSGVIGTSIYGLQNLQNQAIAACPAVTATPVTGAPAVTVTPVTVTPVTGSPPVTVTPVTVTPVTGSPPPQVPPTCG